MTRGGVTQTRTWTYYSVKRERLMSVTHPESGTTSFTYDDAEDLYRFYEATANWRQGYANLNKVVERLGFVPGDLRYPCSNRTEEVRPFWY